MHEYHERDCKVTIWQVMDIRYQAEVTLPDGSRRLTKQRQSIRDVQRDVTYIVTKYYSATVKGVTPWTHH